MDGSEKFIRPYLLISKCFYSELSTKVCSAVLEESQGIDYVEDLLGEVYTRAIRRKKPGGRNSNDEVKRQALCVKRKMVTLSHNHCCNGKTTLSSVCITELSVAVSNIKNIECHEIMLSW